MAALLSRAAAVLVLADASFATHTPACNDACQEAAPKSFEVVGAGLDGSCGWSDAAAGIPAICPDVNGRYTLDLTNTAACAFHACEPDPDEFPQYIADSTQGPPAILSSFTGRTKAPDSLGGCLA